MAAVESVSACHCTRFESSLILAMLQPVEEDLSTLPQCPCALEGHAKEACGALVRLHSKGCDMLL